MELSQNSILIIFFLFEKRLTDRVLLKGNWVDSGPSLVEETSLRLRLRNIRDRLSIIIRKILLQYEFQLIKFYFYGFLLLEEP